MMFRPVTRPRYELTNARMTLELADNRKSVRPGQPTFLAAVKLLLLFASSVSARAGSIVPLDGPVLAGQTTKTCRAQVELH